MKNFFLSRLLGSLSFIAAFVGVPNLRAQTITTVAGSNLIGDGGPATDAGLSNPYRVALDGSGNLFIADEVDQRIRKVSPSGIITTVAGNGSGGFSGDGGLATSASLNSPRGVAVDGSGNLFIADLYNHRIRQISPSGIITTVVGNGSRGFSGDGGAATSASLSYPSGVAVDGSGNLFIADGENQRIRKVSPSGIITTVAGNGSGGFSGDGGPATSASLYNPTGVAVDGSGNLFIADLYNHRIRKVSPNGIITTLAGNGPTGTFGGSFSGDGSPATSALLNFPDGIAVDGSGNLFIADAGNHRIRQVSPSGIITTMVGNGTFGFSGDGGPATSASLYNPSGVVVDRSGNLFIADASNHRIRKVSPNGIITTLAGNGSRRFVCDGCLATSASLYNPSGVALDGSGNLFIADRDNNRIRKVSPSGIITTVSGNGSRGFSGDGGPATSASLYNPSGVVVDRSGNLFIADASNHRIRKVSPSGIITTLAGNGSRGFSGNGGLATSASLYNPTGVAVDGSGNLFIADGGNNRIRQVSPSGIISTVAGNGSGGFSDDGGPATSASLSYPSGVAVDGSGNLFIADGGNNRIRQVSPSGIISTLAGNGSGGFSGDGGPATIASLYNPSGVALDGSGNLFIADLYNHRIRQISPSGIITTLAGNGSRGFSGDGGPATSASLSDPSGVVVDGSGNLFIADVANQRIRKITPNMPPVASAPANQTTTVGQAYSFTVPAFSEPDDQTLTYTASIIPANGLTFDVTTRVISGMPTTTGVTNVTVVGTDPGSMSASVTFTITVNEVPGASLIAGNDGVLTCSIPTLTLRASATATTGTCTYQFAGPGIVATSADSASINASGLYSVTVTDGSTGLSSTTTTTVTSDTALPTATLMASNSLNCAVTSATLTASASESDNYSYFFSSGATQIGSSNQAVVNASGIYSVTVNGANGCTATASANVMGSGVDAPVIVTQPATASAVCAGTLVTVFVAATGSGLQYQWYKDAQSITSATSATLTLNNVPVAQAGVYVCVVTSQCGANTASITSTAFRLTIKPTPVITTSLPASAAPCVGATFVTTIGASGGNLIYNWFKDGRQINGQTSASLTLSNLTTRDAGQYSCVVTNDCGSVTSTVLALTLSPATTIARLATSTVEACEGGVVSVSIQATGVDLSYQWYKDDTEPGNIVTGQTSASLTITNLRTSHSGSYLCVASGSCGSATSSAIVVSVSPATTITAQPASSSVVTPGTTVTIQVVATGNNLAYQWYKDGLKMSGNTKATLTLNKVKVAAAGNYSCIVTGDCGSVTSSTFKLTVTNGVRIAAGEAHTAEALQARLFPNPMVDVLQLEVSGLSLPAQVRLYDIQGRARGEWSLVPQAEEVTLRADISGLGEGLYIVEVATSKGVVYRHRLLKQQ